MLPGVEKPLYKKLYITGIQAETPEAKTFFLTTEDGSPLHYLPGQFLTLVFVRSGLEERRSYSISSTPACQEPLSITVKRVPNGEYSRKLMDRFKVGDELITIGASGFFLLPPPGEEVQRLVFLAAGSGITPVFSLIKTALQSNPRQKILLIYSSRSQEQAIFFTALEQLCARFPDRFSVEFLFSASADLTHSRLSNYWLEVLLKKHGILHPAGTHFYICGPFDYMLMVNITLLAYGVPEKNIKKEHFSSVKAVPKEEPPDRDLHQVTLITRNTEHTFNTGYPVSILQKARSAGIDLPYSCEAGRCGTCVAQCVEGKVWMSNNEVLLEEEMEKGLILTCTGYPVAGNVIIRI